MEMEVICISSDDESNSQKENIKNKSIVNSIEIVKDSNKIEVLSSDDEKVEENNRKRKISHMKEKEIVLNNVEKKRKLDTNHDTLKMVKKSISESKLSFISDVSEVYPIAEPDLTSNDQEIIEKPQLIVIEKKKISYITHDTFPLFISFCLQNVQADEKKDMEKIVNKLKRHYDRLDPAYVSSQEFALFLNKKREAIVINDQQKYMHITEVKNEMKRNSKRKSNSSEYDTIPSCSYATNNFKSNNAIDADFEDDIATSISFKRKRKIKEILITMKKCEREIQKFEEAEVDFNEESDSSYIKVERYKRKMVELYNKYCELSGEHTDAGRAYLRPKHLNTTGIVAMDHAITNFINSKITQRNKVKKKGALTNDLIFPDYRDILQCVNRCNDTKNLGLDKRKREQLAKKAFQELGEHLQRSRKNDYWDTFSLYLENAKEDPAVKDEALKRKLNDNQVEGKKRLTAIFEKYVKRQDEIKERESADETASEEKEEEKEEEEEEEVEEEEEDEEEEEEEGEEEEEEDDEDDDEKRVKNIDDEDKSQNNLPVINLSDEDNASEKTIDKTIMENKSAEKNENNISIVSQNMKISSETLIDKASKQYSEKVKMVSTKKIDVVSKNEIFRNEVHNEPHNTVDSKKQEHLLPISTVNCISNVNRTEENLTEAVMQDVPKIINSMKEVVTTDKTDPTKLTTDVADRVKSSTSKDAAEVTSDNGPNRMDDGVEIMKNTTDVVNKNVPSAENQFEKEKRPLLRVRSFAKPPTTWKDNQHNKVVQENVPKIMNKREEVIDLTDEQVPKSSTKEVKMKKPPILTKCAIKVGDKLIPVINNKTLIIPSKNLITVHNITNVQNITKNYLKVNKGQLISSVSNVPGSKIIRLPSGQVNRQNQQQNTNMVIARQEVPLKGNETIIKVVPSGKAVIVPKKNTVQVTFPVSKQNECSQATKSK